ncbi:MAG: Ig-like domain-containing protein [Fuerstiella sp.]
MLFLNGEQQILDGLELTQQTPTQYSLDLSTVTTVREFQYDANGDPIPDSNGDPTFLEAVVAGDFDLRLIADNAGITDLAGNPLTQDALEEFTIDLGGPEGHFTGLPGGPTNSTVGVVTIDFNEPAATTLGIEVRLFQDNSGTPGAEITSDQLNLNDTFFVEILAGDLRGENPAGPQGPGLIGLPIDIAWDAAAFEEIDGPFAPTSIVTDDLPIQRRGTLDQSGGFIDDLSGGSLPSAGIGSVVGPDRLERFALLRFRADAVVSRSAFTVTIGDGGVSFADAEASFRTSIEAQTITVTDPSAANLFVTVAASSIGEAAGSAATTATVTRTSDTTNALVVNLSSSDTSEAGVPASATIPAGQASVTFDIDAVDDAIVDGTQTVRITAAAAAHADGAGLLDITDDDDILGVDLSDLSLTRDGVDIDISGLTLNVVDGRRFSIDLSSVTTVSGDYELRLTSVRPDLSTPDISDGLGNDMAGDVIGAFTIDLDAPTALFDPDPVTPNLRNTDVGNVAVEFSEIVTGVDVADFTLTRDGVAVSGFDVVQVGDSRFELNLSAFSGTDGDYVLTLASAGSGIVDAAGNLLAAGGSLSWTMDTIAPTVTVSGTTPSPRNSSLGLVTFDFDQDVSGFDIADLTLSLDGDPVDLSGLSITAVSGAQYTVDLSTMTSAAGSYDLQLTAEGSGIRDGAGNLLAVDALQGWVMDLTSPEGTFDDIAPALRNSAVDVAVVQFNEEVIDVSAADFTLTRDGAAIDISGAVVTQVRPSEYTIDLAAATAIDGDYVLTLAASGVTDAAGNPLADDAIVEWTKEAVAPTATISTVVPALRNSPVGVVTIDFSEPVFGLDSSDFTLTRDGGFISVIELDVVQLGPTQFEMDLSTVTVDEGDYEFALTPQNSAITDQFGNLIAVESRVTWTTDTTVPVITIVDVDPDIRVTNAGVVGINFSEDVTGFDVSDVSLRRDGLTIDVSGLSFVAVNGAEYTIDLTTVTDSLGTYTLTVAAAGSGILDAAGNAPATDGVETWRRVDVADLSLTAVNATRLEGNSGAGDFIFRVTRNTELTVTTTVDYVVAGTGADPANRADFGGTFPAGTITFFPGETEKLITVSASGDLTVEPDEQFSLTLSNPSANTTIATATAVGTILDDDTAPVLIQIDLFHDDNGALGLPLNNDTIAVGEKFFAVIRVFDQRATPAGVVGLSADIAWNPAILDEIDNPFDVASIVTTSLPLQQGGTLDNATGLIDELRGGSLPANSDGAAIGNGSFEDFAVLHFVAEQGVTDMPFNVTLGSLGNSLADGVSDFTAAIEQQTITVLDNAEVVVTDNSDVASDRRVQFTTPLSRYRSGQADSPYVRPAFPDSFHYVEVTNSGTIPLTLFETQVNAPDVSVDVVLTSAVGDDIVLQPGQTQRFTLTFAPTLPTGGSNVPRDILQGDGLTILTSAQGSSVINITLEGHSTFNSDISYDRRVNFGEFGALNVNFGKNQSDADYDPSADMNGDGFVNFGDFGPLNVEFGLSIPPPTEFIGGSINGIADGGISEAPAQVATSLQTDYQVVLPLRSNAVVQSATSVEVDSQTTAVADGDAGITESSSVDQITDRSSEQNRFKDLSDSGRSNGAIPVAPVAEFDAPAPQLSSQQNPQGSIPVKKELSLFAVAGEEQEIQLNARAADEDELSLAIDRQFEEDTDWLSII